LQKESVRKDSKRKDCIRKENEWKVRGLIWLFGIRESREESERKETYIFSN